MLSLSPSTQAIPCNYFNLDEAPAARMLLLRRQDLRWACSRRLLRAEYDCKNTRWKIMPVPGNLLPIFAEIRGVEDNVLVSFFARDLRRQWICKVKCVSRQAYFEFLEGNFDGRAVARLAGSKNYRPVRVHQAATQTRYTIALLVAGQ